jgi:type I restriction enzyme S subunit
MSTGFKYLDLSALPDDWTADHFGNLVDYNLGRTPPRNSPYYWKDGIYPWVSISDMKPYGVIQETVEKISQQAFDEVFRGRLAPEGSLLMSFKLTIGRISRLGVPAFHNEAIISFKPDPKKISPEYLGYYLSQINYNDYQDTAIKGQTLNKGKLDSLEISLPPLPEQKAIAHTLATVQRAIRAQERIIQTTTELKKALMQKLFSEGLRGEPQKETEIGMVPESWEVKRFDSFALLQRGFDITKKYQNNGEYPVVSSGGVSSYHNEAKITGPGVVIGRKGSLGTVHFISSDYWPHDTTLWVKDFKGNNPRFVAYLLETMQLKRFDTGAANPTLNRNIVHEEKIPIPPRDQQVEIGKALKAVEEKIKVHESHRHLLQHLLSTLLHVLMTAKIRITNLNGA